MMAKKAAAAKSALAVLTSSQKQEWSRMTGAVFSNWEEPKRRD
jgi:hypothetical protein